MKLLIILLCLSVGFVGCSGDNHGGIKSTSDLNKTEGMSDLILSETAHPIIYSFPGCKSEILSDENTFILCSDRVALLSNDGKILFNYEQYYSKYSNQFERIEGDIFLIKFLTRKLVSPKGEIKLDKDLLYSDYLGVEDGIMYFFENGVLYHVSVTSGEILKKIDGLPKGEKVSLLDGKLLIQSTSDRWHISLNDPKTGDNIYFYSYEDFPSEIAKLKSTIKINEDLTVAIFEAKIASGQSYEFLRFFFRNGDHKDFKTELRTKLNVAKTSKNEVIAFTDGEMETSRLIKFNLEGEKVGETPLDIPGTYLKQLGSVFYHQSSGPLSVYNSEGKKIVEIDNSDVVNPSVFAVTTKFAHVLITDKAFVAIDLEGVVLFKKQFEFSLANSAYLDQKSESLYVANKNAIDKYDLNGNKEVSYLDSPIQLTNVVGVDGQKVFVQTNKNEVLAVNFDSQKIVWKYQVSALRPIKLKSPFLRLPFNSGLAFVPVYENVSPIYINTASSNLLSTYNQGAVVVTGDGLRLYNLQNKLIKFFPVAGLHYCQAYDGFVSCRQFGRVFLFNLKDQTFSSNTIPGDAPLLYSNGQFVTINNSKLYFINRSGEIVDTKDLGNGFYLSDMAQLLPNGNFLFIDTRYAEMLIVKPSGEVVKQLYLKGNGDIKDVNVIGDVQQGSIYVKQVDGYYSRTIKYDLAGNLVRMYMNLINYIPVNNSEIDVLCRERGDIITLYNQAGEVLAQKDYYSQYPNQVMLFEKDEKNPWVAITHEAAYQKRNLWFYNSRLEKQFGIKGWPDPAEGTSGDLGVGALIIDGRLVDFGKKRVIGLPENGDYKLNSQANKIYISHRLYSYESAILALDLDQIIGLNAVKFELSEEE